MTQKMEAVDKQNRDEDHELKEQSQVVFLTWWQANNRFITVVIDR